MDPLSAFADTWGEPINTPGDRFIVLSSYNDEAVYDKETGLVWEQSPLSPNPPVEETGLRTWFDAQIHCNRRTVGNRKGWRLPTIQELASLVDPTVPAPGPPLPAGHPFSRVQSSRYWSATTVEVDTRLSWFVNFFQGDVGFGILKSLSNFVWCVRGGQGVDPQ